MVTFERIDNWGTFGAHSYRNYYVAGGEMYTAVFCYVTCGPPSNQFEVGIANGLFDWKRRLPLATGAIDNWTDAEPLIIAAIEADLEDAKCQNPTQ